MIAVEPEEVDKILEKEKELQIIDIRTFREFRNTHLEKAICIPRDSFAQYMNKIQKHIPIFGYCSYGMKSDEIALFLEKKFKSKVYVLQGGYDAYLDYCNQRKRKL
jgi:rhodanese-related sulfurtransferase